MTDGPDAWVEARIVPKSASADITIRLFLARDLEDLSVGSGEQVEVRNVDGVVSSFPQPIAESRRQVEVDQEPHS
jgi:hypothetical protein